MDNNQNLTLTPEDLKDPAAMGAKIGEWTKKVQAKPLYMPTDAEIATSSYFSFVNRDRAADAFLYCGKWAWMTVRGYTEYRRDADLTRAEAIKRAWNFAHGNS